MKKRFVTSIIVASLCSEMRHVTLRVLKRGQKNELKCHGNNTAFRWDRRWLQKKQHTKLASTLQHSGFRDE